MSKPAKIPRMACESCEDSGIYLEGAEWAPCGECNRGKEFTRLLETSVEEARDRLFSALLSDRAVEAASARFENNEWFDGTFPESGMKEAIQAAIEISR